MALKSLNDPEVKEEQETAQQEEQSYVGEQTEIEKPPREGIQEQGTSDADENDESQEEDQNSDEESKTDLRMQAKDEAELTLGIKARSKRDQST